MQWICQPTKDKNLSPVLWDLLDVFTKYSQFVLDPFSIVFIHCGKITSKKKRSCFL